MPDQTNCSSGQYFCNDRQKCMPIPKGHKVRKDGELVKEVAPPGWGHTKAEKEKTKPNKPKSKIGGTAAAFKRSLDRGDFKGLPGSKTKKEKTSDMFKLMWAMKNKGDKPHYKPGSDKKYKKYQEEEVIYEKLSSRDAKKLDKASALSQSNDPKDQDRARARQTEVDYKDLMRQIQSKKKKSSKSPMNEKYGDSFDTPKQKAKDAAKKKENTDRDLRMKHGKKWRDFTKDALSAKDKERNRLKTGEVKKLVDGKWVSNKS